MRCASCRGLLGRVAPFGDPRIVGCYTPPRGLSQLRCVLHRHTVSRHPPPTLMFARMSNTIFYYFCLRKFTSFSCQGTRSSVGRTYSGVTTAPILQSTFSVFLESGFLLLASAMRFAQQGVGLFAPRALLVVDGKIGAGFYLLLLFFLRRRRLGKIDKR